MRISHGVVIPDEEIEMTFSTSGGPGGQHANRSSTKVELKWNVDRTRALTEQQKKRIKTRLKSRIDSDGDLRVAAQSSRSQLRNRQEAEQRLAKLIAGALKTPKRRVATRPTKASKERRLDSKKRRSETKKARRKPDY